MDHEDDKPTPMVWGVSRWGDGSVPMWTAEDEAEERAFEAAGLPVEVTDGQR